ncbi:hypothetical protein [Sinorhizobium alkalisoli]|uniref:Uncharacterized protein n=1 Tax=Sinorhizobium alkalisoli TaxID=1752398 RepID=A0A1E3V5D9_9HYPH|nr:hypothetical protein [Sinorhizobium alkalisoli]MCG5480880.1 hypothetical protein [Sinorhizobium alkalisoli]ODR88843.1 hypothetical protein A8M32_23925 [Sinorhizobium alkalisoli]QFI70820.1 Glucose-methanol-choline (GMC) oxidoreductase:NAD binding site [Sinorhizobium alkalisoli]
MDRGIRGTESHVQGTLRRGKDRSDSVVDRDLIHYEFRDRRHEHLSCSCANRSLMAALFESRHSHLVKEGRMRMVRATLEIYLG